MHASSKPIRKRRNVVLTTLENRNFAARLSGVRFVVGVLDRGELRDCVYFRDVEKALEYYKNALRTKVEINGFAWQI